MKLRKRKKEERHSLVENIKKVKRIKISKKQI